MSQNKPSVVFHAKPITTLLKMKKVTSPESSIGTVIVKYSLRWDCTGIECRRNKKRK